MKYLMILTVGVCLLFISIPAMAEQAEDEAAIRKVREQIIAAYNKHDAKAMFSLIAENFQSWDGSRKGRAAGEKNLSAVFERQKNVQVKLLEEIGIIFVKPDVAIYKSRNEYSGSVGEDGKPVAPVNYLSANVLVKTNGRWMSTAYFWRNLEE